MICYVILYETKHTANAMMPIMMPILMAVERYGDPKGRSLREGGLRPFFKFPI